jgi:hypothetical protein
MGRTNRTMTALHVHALDASCGACACAAHHVIIIIKIPDQAIA